MPTVKYYCPCLNSFNEQPPPANLASSSSSFHDLNDLYFCEECDAVRCNNCVFIEVSGFYCPNCLFEVPNASVRAEKNRCVHFIQHMSRCWNDVFDKMCPELLSVSTLPKYFVRRAIRSSRYGLGHQGKPSSAWAAERSSFPSLL
jgi:Dynactin p62 family